MKEFIELTLSDKTKKLINVNFISNVGESKSNTPIVTSHNTLIKVLESYEEIKELIKKAKS